MSVKCRLCGLEFQLITYFHLKHIHGIDIWDYRKQFPGVEVSSKEFCQTISEVWERPGYKEETTKAMSEGLLKVMPQVCADPEHSRTLSKAQTRRWAVPGAREKQGETLSKALSGRTFSLDQIENMSKAQKARWARLSPEEVKAEMERGISSPEARRQGAETNAQRGPNKTEKMLWEFLNEKYPGAFMPCWVKPEQIGRRFPDFRSTNGYKLVIEAFGSHWHIFSRTEEEITTEYKELGWSCIVVWANSPEEIIVEWPTLVKRIQEVV